MLGIVADTGRLMKNAAQLSRTYQAPFARTLRQYSTVKLAAAAERRRPTASTTELTSFEFLSYRVWTWRANELRYLIDEIFVREEYRFESTEASPRILDCGSNIGMSVLYFKHTYPDSRVVAFEPDPACFEALRRNVEDNRLDGVEIHNAAVARKAGSIQFFIDPTRAGSLLGSLYQERARGGRPVDVVSIGLSSFLREPAELLKLDIEGAELDVLQDLTESGAIARVREAVIEYHHNLPSGTNRLSEFLAMIEDASFSFNIAADSAPRARRDAFQDVFIRAERR